MKISIALCTYNGAKFLSEQLESFLLQSRLPDELVACDDCSIDETTEILEDFARKSPFPVHIHVNENNLGSTKNFEKAISLCTGDVTFLSDQDDVWLPNKVERMASEFNKSSKVGLVFSNAELVSEQLETTGKSLWDYSFKRSRQLAFKRHGLVHLTLREGNVVTGATLAFRTCYRKFFLPIPQIPGIIHDGWISLIVASLAEVVFLDELLIKYRQHSFQQFGILMENGLEEDFKQFCDRFIKTNELEKQRLYYIKKVLTEAELKTMVEQKRFTDLIAMIPLEEIRFGQSSEHLARRRDLPAARHKRVHTVIKELVNGNYHRFGRGFISAAKDLIRK